MPPKYKPISIKLKKSNITFINDQTNSTTSQESVPSVIPDASSSRTNTTANTTVNTTANTTKKTKRKAKPVVDPILALKVSTLKVSTLKVSKDAVSPTVSPTVSQSVSPILPLPTVYEPIMDIMCSCNVITYAICGMCNVNVCKNCYIYIRGHCLCHDCERIHFITNNNHELMNKYFPGLNYKLWN
jgi:hypothetical protein